MYCKYCGKQINEDSEFCRYCGNKIKIESEKESLISVKNDDNDDTVSDLQTAKKRIKSALIAGIISLVLTIAMFLYMDIEAVYWIDVLLLGLLLYGLYKKNTASAVILVIYFLIGKIIQLVTEQLTIFSAVVGLIFLGYFYLGARGVIKYNKLVKKKKSATKNLIIGIVIGVLVTVFLGYLFLNMLSDYSEEEPIPEETITPQEIISTADYQEGYKAGYTDGRSLQGEMWDSYFPPATEERQDAYTQGYLEGFLTGCREGGFDCSEVENTVEELLQGEDEEYEIKLAPTGI